MIGSRLTRRGFLRGCAAAAALGPATALHSWAPDKPPAAKPSVPVRRVLPLDGDWLFGGKSSATALEASFDDDEFTRVVLPHCVTPLSWQGWNPASWEEVWIYRRHFSVPPEWRDLRLFLHFDRVMAGAAAAVNGHALEPHPGGFLPFDREITGLTKEGENVLTVAVDSHWLNVPPSGSPDGPASIDYLLPGGITGSVELRAFPGLFLREVFAKPVDVLGTGRRVEIRCRVDAAGQLPAQISLHAELGKAERAAATVSENVQMETADQEFNLTLGGLGGLALWDVDHPNLFDLEVILSRDGRSLDRYTTRIGLRDARFEPDGFYLNGRRTQLFGLNRHELFPYLGFAAPARLLRRDAEILKRKFNVNTVRCSHYPQSETFLDACDELGLLVWEELPGWQYIGDGSWRALAMRDVEAMIRRDRNHPSIAIWGVRINESANDLEFYHDMRELAKSLDDSRPASGTMTPDSRQDWQTHWSEDVFAFDDYHAAPDGSVGITEPVEGFPYLITETVGQFNYRAGQGFDRKYRRAGDPVEQMDQALFHAQAHNRAADQKRIAGTLAWCAFDYGSLMHAQNGVKCAGVADGFRIAKLGASFYLAQVDPAVRPVIEPNFYWDFGPGTPIGPGEHAAIFSNCDRLEIAFDLDLGPRMVLQPDRDGFPHLKYPPFFANLKFEGPAPSEMRINGFVKDAQVLSRSFSSIRTLDRLWLQAEDAELTADGADATRFKFGAVDKFGSQLAPATGQVVLKIDGPGVIVGDNPFSLDESGGVGAVYVRTLPQRAGKIRVEAEHEILGSAAVEINVRI